jgi:hypothetical protein
MIGVVERERKKNTFNEEVLEKQKHILLEEPCHNKFTLQAYKRRLLILNMAGFLGSSITPLCK